MVKKVDAECHLENTSWGLAPQILQEFDLRPCMVNIRIGSEFVPEFFLPEGLEKELQTRSMHLSPYAFAGDIQEQVYRVAKYMVKGFKLSATTM